MGKVRNKAFIVNYLSAQTDGQTEVVNRMLSALLRSIIQKNLKNWEDCLPHVELTYNRSVHSATNCSLFEVVFSFNPFTPLDLLPLPIEKCINMDGKKKAYFVKELHAKVRQQIEIRTEQYLRGANRLSLNPGIGFGYICTREDFQRIDVQSYNQEAMVHSKYLQESMTMPTNWTL